MSYVIATCKEDVNYCIRADSIRNKFVLIPVESDSDLSKVFCHPYRVGAAQILQWIIENDSDLANQNLEVFAESKFRI
jgi:hypothetical protein